MISCAHFGDFCFMGYRIDVVFFSDLLLQLLKRGILLQQNRIKVQCIAKIRIFFRMIKCFAIKLNVG